MCVNQPALSTLPYLRQMPSVWCKDLGQWMLFFKKGVYCIKGDLHLGWYCYFNDFSINCFPNTFIFLLLYLLDVFTFGSPRGFAKKWAIAVFLYAEIAFFSTGFKTHTGLLWALVVQSKLGTYVHPQGFYGSCELFSNYAFFENKDCHYSI